MKGDVRKMENNKIAAVLNRNQNGVFEKVRSAHVTKGEPLTMFTTKRGIVIVIGEVGIQDEEKVNTFLSEFEKETEAES